MGEGIVFKSTGSWYEVRTEAGESLNCRTVGKLRLDDVRTTNPIAVGDRVRFERENETDGQIVAVLPRKNYVVRQSPRKKHQLHMIAANIDQAILVTTIVEPDVKIGFIDRFLMMTEPYNIPVLIVFNKCDLYSEDDDALFEGIKRLYSEIGYKVLKTSSLKGTGIDALKSEMQGKTSLLSGQSGVGKTSLINAIEPRFDLKTSEISDYTGKGQHTTTFAEMFDLKSGGYFIDTPGIKTLGFNHFEVLDVAHNFKEIFEASSECKFANCTHRNEPKCAVKEAVDEGRISELRYGNYLQIVLEVEDQNYWERNTDF